MSQINLFKVSNFKLLFKDQTSLELMITAVNIPGINLGELTFNRPVLMDIRNGDTLKYDELLVTVLCDESFSAFKDVYNYIIKSADPTTGELNVVSPVFDSTLFLTTNKNNINHQIHFYDCFLKTISSMNLLTTSDDETQLTFDITVGYTYYIFDNLT